MATIRAVAAMASLNGQVQQIGRSAFAGKEVVATQRLPCMVAVSRSVVEARQGEIQRRSAEAVKSLVGEEGVRKLQQLSFVAMNAMLAMPALAEEKGKIFDFNLTLPIIAAQFLLLMVALDNIWFKPVAKVMDTRDEEIRKKLVGVRDNSSEIKSLQAEAEAVIRAARAETGAALSKMKKETAAELDAKLQAVRSRIEKELADAIKNLEEQKESTMKNLDAQVQTLSEEIVRKLIPFKA